MNRPQSIDWRGQLGNALIYFCGFGLEASAVLKFLRPDVVVAYLGFLGYEEDKYFVIATIELLTAFLFLIRSTRPAGLLLVSTYLGGAISAHLANHPRVAGGPFLMFTSNHPYLSTLPADIFFASAWIGVWLRTPRILSIFDCEREARILRVQESQGPERPQ
jgi:hypothetical protein